MNDPTEFTLFLRSRFVGLRFRAALLKQAGRLFKNAGPDEAARFLEGKDQPAPPNFQPPVKCSIVAASRPLGEWDIARAGVAVQKYVYAQTYDEFQRTRVGTSSGELKAWITKSKIDLGPYWSVQGLNKIVPAARARYEGVVLKVANRNAARAKKLSRINEARRARGEAPLVPNGIESAFNTDGRLAQPPGLDGSIYGYQQVSPRALIPGEVELPPIFRGYARKADDVIVPHVPADRTTIAEGQPGYVPLWQRPLLTTSKHRRMRGHWASPEKKAESALLVIVKIQADWAVIDLRALLRNAQWRGVITKDTPTTIDTLLALVTGDPVLDPERDLCTFTYKPEVVGVCSKKVIRANPKVFEALRDDTVSLTAIDLGATNPIAAATYKVTSGTPELLQRETLPREFIVAVDRMRRAHDTLEEQIRLAAVVALLPDQQVEVAAIEHAAETTKQAICARLALDPTELPWSAMTGHSTYISDAVLRAGGASTRVMWRPFVRSGAASTDEKKTDLAWAREVKPRLTPETRSALNENIFEQKRTSEEYARLATRNGQFARRAVNYIVRSAEKRAKCGKTILAVEDLNVRFFHGGGKRDPGWDGFFAQKREGRWLIQALHKSFCDLAAHRGYRVIECPPAFTSQACPACAHIDAANRATRDREAFCCTACGWRGNADLDVATHNIAMVALRGRGLKVPASGLSATNKYVVASSN